MIDANAIANLQMLMNTGDGRQAVLAELLQSDKPSLNSAMETSIGSMPKQDKRLSGLYRFAIRDIKIAQEQNLHRLLSVQEDGVQHSRLPANIIATLDRLPRNDKAPLIHLAEGLAYQFNNIFMAVVGHLSIVMFKLKADTTAYDQLRECEELIHNTALLLRLLVDVFHRSHSEPITVYPIDLSDHEISNRIFSNNMGRQTSENVTPSELSIQKVQTIIATIMGKRLRRIFQILQHQTTRVFHLKDLQAYAVEHHQAIQLQIKKGISIANDLLKYANADEIEHRLISLNTIVKDSIAIHQSRYSSLKVKVISDSTPVYLKGNAHLLSRMLLEILSNANDAIPHGGEVTIKLRRDKATTSDLLIDSIGSVKAQLLIEDNGAGLPEHLGIRAFDPFTTTPKKRKRRGMGLAVVLGIVKAHGGTIGLFNRHKGGLVLIIDLPL